VVISDWGALDELIMHGIAKDREEAAGLAAGAGVDIDMMTTCYSRHIKKLALEDQKYLELIDEAAFRILQLKNKLGLFENPYKDADEAEEAEIILCREHRNEAKEAAIESMVLLKNENILPLKKSGQKIAFIGPHVNSQWIYGAWSIFARPEDTVTLMEGVNSLGIKEAVFANGCAMADSIDASEINNTKIDPEVHEKLRKEALDYALNADVVVLALGEHPSQTGEAASRAELDIPKPQLELFRQVYEVNKNIAVVLFSGRPLEIKEISDKAKAVLEVWMPGTEGGNAIAEVLFGDAVPSGKLAMSMPYCVGQVPVFYSEFHTGRPYAGSEGKGKYFSRYLDIPNKPLYPFGYGLSYTDFEISKVRLSSNELTKESSLKASVTVKNIGSFTGKEVVQLYIQDKFGSVARPVRELKGFRKVELKPGEEKKIVFSITEEMLRFYDINMNYVSEPGEFNVYIGNSSDTQNGKSFVLI
jgi:beta-glucosidase